MYVCVCVHAHVPTPMHTHSSRHRLAHVLPDCQGKLKIKINFVDNLKRRKKSFLENFAQRLFMRWKVEQTHGGCSTGTAIDGSSTPSCTSSLMDARPPVDRRLRQSFDFRYFSKPSSKSMGWQLQKINTKTCKCPLKELKIRKVLKIKNTKTGNNCDIPVNTQTVEMIRPGRLG